MKLAEDAVTQTGRAFSDFMDQSDEMATQMNEFFEELEEETNGFFSSFLGGASELMESMFADFNMPMSSNGEAEEGPEENHEGNPEVMTKFVETISYHRDADGAYTSDKTIETTHTFADGSSTRTIEHLPGPSLTDESDMEDILVGYKEVIEALAPQVLELSDEMAHDLAEAFDVMYDNFEEKAKDMDEEDVWELSGVEKEELVNDYRDFEESFEGLENKEDIGADEVVSSKLNKLADNFSKVMKFA